MNIGREIAAGQTWVEWQTGQRHVIERVTGMYVFHVREGSTKVERTRTKNFTAHCRLEDK